MNIISDLQTITDRFEHERERGEKQSEQNFQRLQNKGGDPKKLRDNHYYWRGYKEAFKEALRIFKLRVYGKED